MTQTQRKFINELTDGEPIDEVFVAAQKQLRTNRQGNPYLQLRLMDRTGSVTGMLWNANEKLFDQFDNGDYVHAQGKAQFYNGAMQIILQKVVAASDKDVDPGDFETLTRADTEALVGRAGEMLRALKNFHLRNLAECFLIDDDLMGKIAAAPAGIKHHHAFRGGLLQHTVAMMELAEFVAPRYPGIDPDLLIMGAFTHDLGKVDELSYARDLDYTDEGQLLGHLVQGVRLLDEKVAEAEKLSGEKIPAELVAGLKHIVLSHHGTHEFGSPKLPMTLEAIAVHHIDSLDSKLNAAIQIIDEDPNKDSCWTTYQPSIGRKLLKPGATFADGDSSGA